MAVETETTPPKPLPVAAGVLSALALVFGSLLSIWGAIGFVLSIGVFWAARKIRKNDSVGWKSEITIPSGLLAVGVLISFLASPLGLYLRSSIESQHAEAGGDLSFDESSFDPLSFSLTLDGYAFAAHGFEVKAKSIVFQLDAMVAFANDVAPVRIHASDVDVFTVPADMKSDSFSLTEIPVSTASNVNLHVQHEDISLSVHTEEVEWAQGNWMTSPSKLNIEYLSKSFQFEILGQIIAGVSDGEFDVAFPSLTVSREKEFHAMIRGGLGGESKGVQVTLDYINLNAFWSKYRIIDEHWGKARGTAILTGGWEQPVLNWNIDLDDWGYYHKAAMDLDKANAFVFQQAECKGEYRFGSDLHLRLNAVGSLATGKDMNANGLGQLDLYVKDGTARADAAITVMEGEINQSICWSGATRGLGKITPNTVLLLEELPAIDVKWSVDVQALTLHCAPLSGTLSGVLEGSIARKEGSKVSVVRADGTLEISDGQFEFLGANGTVEGEIQFKPVTQMQNADLNGTLSGMVGETPLTARIRGLLSRPGFFFTGVRQSPQTLGQEIFAGGEFSEAVRTARTTRLCGPEAALRKNPFMAKTSRRVFFQFE
ncbi:hypothetical protein OAU50_06170 [Planctomycetota bacterium]|nr:hypothetical protein [Planctomycetota bacterium]